MFAAPANRAGRLPHASALRVARGGPHNRLRFSCRAPAAPVGRFGPAAGFSLRKNDCCGGPVPAVGLFYFVCVTPMRTIVCLPACAFAFRPLPGETGSGAALPPPFSWINLCRVSLFWFFWPRLSFAPPGPPAAMRAHCSACQRRPSGLLRPAFRLRGSRHRRLADKTAPRYEQGAACSAWQTGLGML